MPEEQEDQLELNKEDKKIFSTLTFWVAMIGSGVAIYGLYEENWKLSILALVAVLILNSVLSKHGK